MKTALMDILICPGCLPEENGLACQSIRRIGEDIISGSLQCKECGSSYPIREGIASLIRCHYPGEYRNSSRYESPGDVSSYLWSHYADLFGDRDATGAYGEWGELLRANSGFALDAGCSVGRFTFEMSKKCDFAVGIDNSLAFIRTARRLMTERRMDFRFPEEGLINENGLIHLPAIWASDKVEFIVGDVQFLPFRSNCFTSLASLNLIDKIPFPLKHLKEMNRVSKKTDAQFLFSDPFSWSSDIAKEADWLGGTTNGAYRGRGVTNVFSLLKGGDGAIAPPWNIEERGYVWWKIRNHRNHFELIRSCFIKANR